MVVKLLLFVLLLLIGGQILFHYLWLLGADEFAEIKSFSYIQELYQATTTLNALRKDTNVSKISIEIEVPIFGKQLSLRYPDGTHSAYVPRTYIDSIRFRFYFKRELNRQPDELSYIYDLIRKAVEENSDE